MGRDHLPDWEKLWDDFVQEEIRESGQRGDQKNRFKEEENLALARKAKKNDKKGTSEGSSSKGEKKRDPSQVKCFAC